MGILRTLGDVFQIEKTTQLLFSANVRAQSLVRAHQQLRLEAIGGSTIYPSLFFSEIKSTDAATVPSEIRGVCTLLLTPGTYGWTWDLETNDSLGPCPLPIQLTTSYSNIPLRIDLTQKRDFSVNGTAHLRTLVSGRSGEKLNTRAKIRCNLLEKERLTAKWLLKT